MNFFISMAIVMVILYAAETLLRFIWIKIKDNWPRKHL